ncbi:M48 family metallopeptidase [Pseudoprimorskyibacter insulae]|uniref:Metalloprotease LoiP n=1 Tax=Pseudoprimorskyibacter insulae TaxID=1695997 RepID=A0A2R8ANW0_9RHOB|nr:M48 family metallopeptidase [Pseudoprimorskyibacter insulae]SPF77723.1 Metalloprotease LoiP [Pseudoprimorskyibacter insulae]
MTVIHVGAAPEPFNSSALFLDGHRARPVPVDLTIDEDGGALVWSHDDTTFRWPLGDIRELPDQADRSGLVLRHRDDALVRLHLPDRGLVPRLPNRTKRAPVARRGRLALWAVAAIASVALIIFVLVPRMADQLAVFIPPEGERALGEVTLDQIRHALDETGVQPVPICNRPAGRAGLDQLATRLTDATDTPVEISLTVLDHPMINAFALPGGFIILSSGLIRAAETPEQLASVIGHEIGHVVSRDPTRHALRSAGSIGVLGLVFGDFAGGTVVLFLANQLINAQYSQTAEADADTFAHDLLVKLDVPPSALADMFDIIRKRYGDAEGLIAHFLSHPSLGDRIETARNSEFSGIASAPLVSPKVWSDIRSICR